MASSPETPPLRCVHQLIAGQARRTPQAVAVQFGNDTLTYAEVNARANRLARRLIDAGVGPDVLVGLSVERSLDMAVALLGIFKAGGAYVPLDPTYPSRRLELMLEDAAPRVLVTQRHLLERVPVQVRTVVLADEPGTMGDGEEADDPESPVGPEHLAYVIYTSGSTGRPKGVMIEHRSLANVLGSMRRLLQFTAHDVLLAVSTISFDVGCMDLCLPLMVGARVVVVGSEDAMFPGRVAHRLSTSGATFLQGTPSMWRMILDGGWSGDGRLQMLATGEALTETLADPLLARGARLWNGYGATETGIYATVHDVQRGESPIPVGRPISDATVLVLGEDGTPVQQGDTGELHVGGSNLARGYLNQPELSREKFVADPSSAVPGARLYRTGDLGRLRPDGVVEYMGRSDQLVKLRGFRVELGEIESTLAKHPAVKEAVVVVREVHGGDRSLVAYVVPTQGSWPMPKELRRHVQDRLPLFMVPAAVVVLEAFPLTPTRKVDRLALPPP